MFFVAQTKRPGPFSRDPAADFVSFAWRLDYLAAGAASASPRVRNNV